MREGVVGNPVEALDEDRLLVDDEDEAGAVLVFLILDAHVTQPDAGLVRVEHLVACVQDDDDIVERLLAIAARPPELGVGDIELHGCGREIHRHRDRRCHLADRRRNGQGGCGIRVFYVDDDRDMAVGRRERTHRGEPR